MTFDARELKQLKPGEHITSPDYPGLRLEAFSDRRTWTYRYRSPIDAKLRQVKIGLWPSMSVHAAIAEWEKLRKRREAGEDPAAEKRATRAAKKSAIAAEKVAMAVTAYTVAKVCDDYWTGHILPHRAQKGATEIKRLFDKELADIADVPAIALTRAQAFDLIQTIAAKKPVIAGQLRTELGAAWDYAMDAGKIPETTPNWWRKILRGKLRSKGKKIAGEYIGTTKRVLTPDEIGALIRWLPNFTALLEDALTMYLWTAVRGAEIVVMEGREIAKEDTGWWWTIPKAKTKNARFEHATDLRVPLFGRALAVVLRRKERYGDGWLFPARNKRDTHTQQKTIQAKVYWHQPYSETRPDEIRPRLPVSHWAPHDLRRTARTLLASMGCPKEVAESVLGHMLPGVEGVYNLHTYDNERLEWLKRLSDRLEALAAR